MPKRHYRFEDFGRTGRYAHLRALRYANNDENHESSSSASSDMDVDLEGMASNADSGSIGDLDDVDEVPQHGDGEGMASNAESGSIADLDDVDEVLQHEEEASGDEVGPEIAVDNSDTEGEDGNGEADEANGEESGSDHEDLQSDHGEDEQVHVDVNGNVPLYPGAPVTVGESMHMILSFALNHNLTGKCIGDLLQLISLHCIEPNRCLTSLYHFKKYFKNAAMPMRRHFYCSKCSNPMDGDNCNRCQANDKSYFITIPIVPQLRAMFGRQSFRDKLRYRFDRVKENENNYEDVYDGHIYKSLWRAGRFLTDPNAISFCWNTDGVPVFKSSKYSMWPFYLRINELPYESRVRKENIILAGLWFGEKKPIVNMFLLPLLPELTLLSNGVEIAIPPEFNHITVKARILNGTCDMPAKALFLSMVSYNGYYGCTACQQRGERTPGNRHVYRYEQDITMRSDEEIEEYAELADELGEPFLGVKDLTVLTRMTDFPVTGTAIDPMHKYSGIVKKLMTVWFSPEFHDHPASISQMVRLVNQRLVSITPPMFVERLPRSLAHLNYYKVSELKLFLFCYSIPILHDLLPARYFDHFKLLVQGLFLLNQTSISPEMIQLASSLLREFVLQYEDWYGIEHMTCNVHQLLHLSTFTENLGPLFASSCAPFESMNGVLKKYVHGTRYAELQVCTAASLYLSLSVFKDGNLRQGGPAQEFCNRLSKRQERLRLVRITESVSAADLMKLLHPVPAAIINALQAIAAPVGNVHVFKKAFYQRRLYVAQSYLRAKKTKSCCVKFRNGNRQEIGLVQNFLRVSACECQILCHCQASCYAIVNLYEVHSPFSTFSPRCVLNFIHECVLTDRSIAVNVEDFTAQCFHIVVADVHKIFVVEPVNEVESDD